MCCNSCKTQLCHRVLLTVQECCKWDFSTSPLHQPWLASYGGANAQVQQNAADPTILFSTYPTHSTTPQPTRLVSSSSSMQVWWWLAKQRPSIWPWTSYFIGTGVVDHSNRKQQGIFCLQTSPIKSSWYAEKTTESKVSAAGNENSCLMRDCSQLGAKQGPICPCSPFLQLCPICQLLFYDPVAWLCPLTILPRMFFSFVKIHLCWLTLISSTMKCCSNKNDWSQQW